MILKRGRFVNLKKKCLDCLHIPRCFQIFPFSPPPWSCFSASPAQGWLKTRQGPLPGLGKLGRAGNIISSYIDRSEDPDPVPPPRGVRRPSLPAKSGRKISSSSSSSQGKSGWSTHYERKKSVESLDRLTSRTLSPAPETLPRKFSRCVVKIRR